MFATHGQPSSIRDINESGNAEEPKGGGVCQSERYGGVLMRVMHIHVAISGNDELLSHGFIDVASNVKYYTVCVYRLPLCDTVINTCIMHGMIITCI